jgi:hypothetical protein
MSLLLLVVIALTGAIAQFVDSAAGMGFGTFSATAMIFGGIDPLTAVATVNLAKVGTGITSGAAHWRLGNVRRDWALTMTVTAVPAAIIAAALLSSRPTGVFEVVVPVALALMGGLLLWRHLAPSFRPVVPKAIRGGATAARERTPWLPVAGVGAGMFGGFAGSFGPIATSVLAVRSNLHPRFAVGTASVVEIGVSLAAVATIAIVAGFDNVNWTAGLVLLVAGMVTAPMGAWLSRRLPGRVIGVVVGLLLVTLNAVVIAGKLGGN